MSRTLVALLGLLVEGCALYSHPSGPVTRAEYREAVMSLAVSRHRSRAAELRGDHKRAAPPARAIAGCLGRHPVG